MAFFVKRPRQLLLKYCDTVLSQKDPLYEDKIQKLIAENSQLVERHNKSIEESISRADAVQLYLSNYIESVIQEGEDDELIDSNISELHYAAQLGEEYYSKITASLGPVFDKINKTSAGDIFSWKENDGSLPIIQLENVIKNKQVIYIGLDAMTNKAMSDAVGQAIISDLISLCGRLYKEPANEHNTFYLHADEFSEIVRDEFVTLLNKAGGAGVRVTAYTQTVNDLGAAFGSHQDKSKMLLGNFGTTIMMRIANRDTAKFFTDCLETVRSRSATPSTMVGDRSEIENGEVFSSHNTDVVSEHLSQIITENELFSLPKGQAFVLTNGSEILKIRIPLLKNDETLLQTFESVMQTVNAKNEDATLTIIEGQKSKKEEKVESLPAVAETKNDNVQIAQQFMNWLRGILEESEKPYRINLDELIFTAHLQYGSDSIFLSDDLFENYYQTANVYPDTVKQALFSQQIAEDKNYFVKLTQKTMPVIRITNFKMVLAEGMPVEIIESEK